MKLSRPRILIVSAVLPFPAVAGQRERVRNKLLALRESFETTFLTFAESSRRPGLRQELKELCDHAVVMESLYTRSTASRWSHRVRAAGYAALRSLKTSNYLVGELELSPQRVLGAIDPQAYDLALFEYWHSHRAAAALRRRGVPSVLDMHNLLWQSFGRQLEARPRLPSWLRRRKVTAYRRREEAAWGDFDGLISINAEEDTYVRRHCGPKQQVFYAPMGIDLGEWPFDPQPASPPRLAYFGGLGSVHNQRDARSCYEKIMPLVWQQLPEAELWIVGSNPPAEIRNLEESDSRVHVTGFVEDAPPLLNTMSLVLCPWQGTYGFRSRLVQVMALGLPVIASKDAVAGMDLRDGQGIFLESEPENQARRALELLKDPMQRRQQGELAHQQVAQRYSFEATYGRLTQELLQWQKQRKGVWKS
ncbi:MAG: glycosyltransferase family 4 protein [Deltaproteobacteria bacterium]|nr:glycosyltransferase family 4 protein [Deltaproteobacteria bacterium]